MPSFCRAHNTLAGYGSHSTAQTVLHPSSFAASIPPPAPANKANSFMFPDSKYLEEKKPLGLTSGTY
jgi:hypothetical protein